MLLDINSLKAHVCIFVYFFTRLLCISFIAPMKANLHTVSFNEKSQHYLYTLFYIFRAVVFVYFSGVAPGEG